MMKRTIEIKPVTNSQIANAERKTLILTGASRGIGHATVKRFSSAGWRVITCSRQPFPENCPWEMGPEDHIQLDLADPNVMAEAIGLMKERLKDHYKENRPVRISTISEKEKIPRKFLETIRHWCFTDGSLAFLLRGY